MSVKTGSEEKFPESMMKKGETLAKDEKFELYYTPKTEEELSLIHIFNTPAALLCGFHLPADFLQTRRKPPRKNGQNATIQRCV